VKHYNEALARYDELGATYDYADTMERLGDSHAAAGRPAPAGAAWRTALSLFAEQRRANDATRVAGHLIDDN
jgi:predicted TPR repeat methyltransferase